MLGKTVQSLKKQAPIYTMTGRSKRGGFSEDLQRIHVESDAELKSMTTLNINKAEINAMGNAELDLKIKSDSLAINNYGKALE